MLIVCPSCASRYSIDDDKIGQNGRTVRCASCRTDFFVRLGDNQSAGLAVAPEPNPGSQEPEPAPPPVPSPPVAAKPPPPPPPPPKKKSADDDLAAQWLAEMEAEGNPVEAEPEPEPVPEPVPEPESPPPEELDQAAMNALFDAEMAAAESEAESIAEPEPEPEPAPPAVTGWRKLLPAWFGKAKTDRRKSGAAQKPGKAKKRDGSPRPASKPGSRSGQKRTPGKQGIAARLKGPIGLGLVGMLLLLGGITQRQTVVKLMPASAGLFSALSMPVNIKGLEFADIRSVTQTEGAARFLIVEGGVRSVHSDTIAVPLIEIRLRGEDGRTLYTWTAEPPRKSLKPGEALHFRTRLATPPEAGRNIEVRFTDKMQSATAGS